MNLPGISIVTPSFNQGQFLERTIDSVLSQNYPNLEYFVMDAGSSDNSVDVIKRHREHIDFWRSQRDKGQSDAICEGWKRSKGEVLAWLNSDDYYYPNALATVGQFFAQHPDVLVLWGAIAIVDEKGAVLRTKPPKQLDAVDLLLFKDVPGQAAAFVRRSVFEQLGGPRLDLHYVMDWELWLRIALRYPPSAVALINDTLAGATEWAGAKTSTAATADLIEVRRIFDEVFSSPTMSEEVRRVRRQALARSWWRQSKAELNVGSRAAAARSLAKSVCLSPGSVRVGKTLRQLRRIVFC